MHLTTRPTLHDLQPREVFRELLQEKQLPSDELSAVFDELLALREEKDFGVLMPSESIVSIESCAILALSFSKARQQSLNKRI